MWVNRPYIEYPGYSTNFFLQDLLSAAKSALLHGVNRADANPGGPRRVAPGEVFSSPRSGASEVGVDGKGVERMVRPPKEGYFRLVLMLQPPCHILTPRHVNVVWCIVVFLFFFVITIGFENETII